MRPSVANLRIKSYLNILFYAARNFYLIFMRIWNLEILDLFKLLKWVMMGFKCYAKYKIHSSDKTKHFKLKK